MGGTANRRTLIAIYVVMAIAVTTVAIVCISAGQDLDPESSIAGGYDLTEPDPCLGASFDLRQSGEFVNIENADGSLGGSLRTEQGRLTGDVSCVDDESAELRAQVADRELTGMLGGRQITAELTRDPPPPGPRPQAPRSIVGEYKIKPRSACLGAAIAIEGDRSEVELLRGEQVLGEGSYDDGKLTGEVECPETGMAPIEGVAADRTILLTVGEEKLTAEKQRESGSLFAAFFVAVAVVMLFARLFGMLAVRIGQPRVMGEVLAGIVLGPTVVGALFPAFESALFPSDLIPYIGVVAQLGLIFYMFLVGLEVDLSQIRGRVGQVAAISNVSVALPMMLGIAVALPVYELVGPDKKFVAFALFMGVSMSITAFPVLARILVERRMLKRPVGVLALACAAVDDVTAWFLIALATAVAAAGSGADVAETIGLAILFSIVMAFAIRPLLARVSTAYDEAGRVPGGWVAADLRGRAPVRLRDGADRDRADLRRIRDGPDHAAARGAHRGRDPPDRGLRGHAAAAAVLRLHRPADQHRPARSPRAVADHRRAAGRGRDRQAGRRDGRRPPHRLRLAPGHGDRHADEHPRSHRADRAEPGARARGHLRGAVRDARPDGAGDHLHGGSGAQAARPQERARRPGRGGAGGGSGGSQ